MEDSAKKLRKVAPVIDCPTQRFHYLVTQALNIAVKNNIKTFNEKANLGGWQVQLSIDFGAMKDSERGRVQEMVQNGVKHNQCQLDILDLLRLQSGYLSGAKIQAGLEDKGIFHGDSTVKHGLADLVASLFLKLGPNGRGYQIT